MQSLLDYQGRWIAETRGGATTVWSEVGVPVKSLCPCSKEIADYGAHNQRSLVTIRLEQLQPVPWHEQVRFAEDAASSEIWPLLKRPDEKWITERAYENPKFVEDLVRDVALQLNADARVGRYSVDVENFESIHNHSRLCAHRAVSLDRALACASASAWRTPADCRRQARSLASMTTPCVTRTMSPAAATIHDPFAMRRAGRELLSLALIDARNRTLRWLSAFHGANVDALRNEFDPPLWLVGHVAWFQECAIARNLHRAQGAAGCHGTTLASIEPRADAWFDPTISTREQRWRDTDVADAHLRDYLAATLDATLELLERAPEDDAGLQLFRLVLAREDWAAETLAAMAQAAGLGGPSERGHPRAQPTSRPAAAVESSGSAASTRELWPIWPSRVRREPLWFGAQRVSLGTRRGGFVPDNERWAHDEPVPEFEIDAQPVQWSQYVEFVDDGGYDEPRWWSQAGWAMARAPAAPCAALRGADGPCRARAARRAAAARGVRAGGGARELARSRCVVPLGLAAPAHRARMGDRRHHRRVARLRVGRCARVDGRSRGALERRAAVARAGLGRRRRAARRCVRCASRAAAR